MEIILHNNQTSLFGNNNNNQTNNLFGNNNNNNNSNSLFGNNNTIYNNNGLFSSNNNSIFNNNNINKNSNIPQNFIPSFSILQPLNLTSTNDINAFSSNPIKNYIFGQDNSKGLLTEYLEKLNSYKSNLFNNNSNENYDDYKDYNEFKEFLNYKRMSRKYKYNEIYNNESLFSDNNLLNINVSKSFSPKKNEIIVSNNKNPKIKDLIEPIRSDFYHKNIYDLKYKKAHSYDNTYKLERKIMTNLETSFNKNLELEDFPHHNKPVNNYLNIHIQILQPYRVTFSLTLTKNTKFILFKQSICDTLKKKNNNYKNLTINSFILMKKYSILKENTLISECDLNNEDTLFIILKESLETNNYNTNNIENNKNKNELAPIDKLPHFTKPGYKIEPNLQCIYRMTLEELENVKNFTISNEFGKIVFNEPVDLTNINLDKIVEISPGNANIYFKSSNLSPNKKILNKKATITLYKIENRKEDNNNDLLSLEYQKNKIDIIGGEFISYDKENKEFIYKVEHF